MSQPSELGGLIESKLELLLLLLLLCPSIYKYINKDAYVFFFKVNWLLYWWIILMDYRTNELQSSLHIFILNRSRAQTANALRGFLKFRVHVYTPCPTKAQADPASFAWTSTLGLRLALAASQTATRLSACLGQWKQKGHLQNLPQNKNEVTRRSTATLH